jgi:putative membrane protein
MNEPSFQRIHPLTILIEASRAIRRLLFVIIVFGFSALMGGRDGGIDTTELIFGGLGLLVAVQAIVRYATFRFAIHRGSLIVKQGLFTKQDRVIPIDRIQNINLKREFLHQILGLVDLEIETAAGAKAEAVIGAVTEDQAHLLKQQLLGNFEATASPVVEQRREEVVYAASPWELFLAGATENKIFVIFASVAGLFGVSSQMVGDAIETAARNVVRGPAQGWGLWVLIGLGALLLGWIFSIVSSFISYWNFEVAYRDGRFRRSYGLISRFENVVPLRRIQIVRLTDNLLQRWLGVSKLYMETAGAFSEQGSGEERGAARPTALMAPLIPPAAALALAARVMPGLNVDLRGWKGVPSSSILRNTLAALPWVALVSGGVAWQWQWWGLAAFAVLMGLVLLGARAAWRNTRWHTDGERVMIQRGFLWRRLTIAPIEKIQQVTVTQSPIQKWLGLAAVELSTAAQGGAAEVAVRDLPAPEAASLAAEMHRLSALTAWRNPDGF